MPEIEIYREDDNDHLVQAVFITTSQSISMYAADKRTCRAHTLFFPYRDAVPALDTRVTFAHLERKGRLRDIDGLTPSAYNEVLTRATRLVKGKPLEAPFEPQEIAQEASFSVLDLH